MHRKKILPESATDILQNHLKGLLKMQILGFYLRPTELKVFSIRA